MKKAIYLFIMILLLTGCHPKPVSLDDDVEVIEIPGEIMESVMDIAENYRYITLDVRDNVEAALGAITKLRVFRDKLYVMDDVISKKILIFDNDGTFLKRVGIPGRGPREYIDLSTFELDYMNEELLIEDNSGQKTLVFDLDGNYKRSIGNSIRGRGIAVLPNGNMVYGVEGAFSNDGRLDKFKLIICDSENNPVEWYIEDNTQYPFGYTSHNFMNPGFDGTVTFAPQLMKDVYRISDTVVKRIYSIDLPDMVDRNDFETYKDPIEFNQSSSARKTRFEGNHADSEDYLYFRYLSQKKYRYAYYNKKDKTCVVCSDNLCAKCLTFDERGNMWGALSASDIFLDESAKAMEIKKIIEDSGNPVVVCYNLK